jgi:hypothetical protein
MKDLRVRLPAIQCSVAHFLSPAVDFIVHTTTTTSTSTITTTADSSALDGTIGTSIVANSFNYNSEMGTRSSMHPPDAASTAVSILSGSSSSSLVGGRSTSSRSQRLLGSATKRNPNSRNRNSHNGVALSVVAAGVHIRDVLLYVSAREALLKESSGRQEGSSSFLPQQQQMQQRNALVFRSKSMIKNPKEDDIVANKTAASPVETIVPIFSDRRRRPDSRLPPKLIIADEHGHPIRELGATFANERTFSVNNLLKRSSGIACRGNTKEVQ